MIIIKLEVSIEYEKTMIGYIIMIISIMWQVSSRTRSQRSAKWPDVTYSYPRSPSWISSSFCPDGTAAYHSRPSSNQCPCGLANKSSAWFCRPVSTVCAHIQFTLTARTTQITSGSRQVTPRSLWTAQRWSQVYNTSRPDQYIFSNERNIKVF